jgi:hypothetical protein
MIVYIVLTVGCLLLGGIFLKLSVDSWKYTKFSGIVFFILSTIFFVSYILVMNQLLNK